MTAPRGSFDFRLIDTPAGALPTIVRGPATGPQLLFVPPLFEEMNRTRTLLAGIGRRLAARGIGSWLPDLPGTGDSDRALTKVRWQDWRDALAALSQKMSPSSENHVITFAVRGGALLDDAADATLRLRLAPVTSGDRQLRELLRTRQAADQEGGSPTSIAALESRLHLETVELGGYPITPALAADLRSAVAAPAVAGTVAALSGGTGDHSFDGPPVWRQAEPAAAQVLAVDLADWIAECVGR